MERWPSGQWQQTVNLPGQPYVGSNPTLSTTVLCFDVICLRYARSGRGCSSMVEQKPSKLTTRVRFPSPAPNLDPDPTTKWQMTAVLKSVRRAVCPQGHRLDNDGRQKYVPNQRVLQRQLQPATTMARKPRGEGKRQRWSCSGHWEKRSGQAVSSAMESQRRARMGANGPSAS
jgi:hypothetical protein